MCKCSEWHSVNCCHDCQKGRLMLLMVGIRVRLQFICKIYSDCFEACSRALHRRTTWSRAQHHTSADIRCQYLYREPFRLICSHINFSDQFLRCIVVFVSDRGHSFDDVSVNIPARLTVLSMILSLWNNF